MKICFIAPASSAHIIKWANWFSARGHEVHLITFADNEVPGARVHYIDARVSITDSDSKKIKYLLYGNIIKKIVKEINPDIVNAHYVTSYGAATALSGLKGYVLSVWGSDVYDFPLKSPLHKALVKFSLYRAGHIFSTSHAMAKETKKYTNKDVDITPFGVDMDLFNPAKKEASANDFVIGTVKALHSKYGIEYLLRAASEVVEKRPDIPLKVRIAGKGPMEKVYKELANKLNIDSMVSWLGFIPQYEAAKEWANMDVAIVSSTLDSESFGVSAVEAEACGTAVIISDIPGLMEATKPGVTSVVVPRKNSGALADAIIDLYDNADKRISLGVNGRLFAENVYDMNSCFKDIEKLFVKYAKR